MFTIEKSAHNLQAMQSKNDTDKMTQANNWMTHNTGEASLLQSNSPSFYTSGLAHRLFVDGRMHLVCNPYAQ